MGDLEDPAGRRDGHPVAGEPTDERVRLPSDRLACDRYAAARRGPRSPARAASPDDTTHELRHLMARTHGPETSRRWCAYPCSYADIAA